VSDTTKHLTADQRIAASAARRAERAEAEADARKEQFADDLEAIEAIEAKLGARVRYSAQVSNFVPGLPVIVGVRPPEPAEHKRFVKMVNANGNNADAKIAAVAQLAQLCWVYPEDKFTRDAMVQANAGLISSVGNFAYSLGDVELKDEGKE
jgi:hypothetical protein